MRKFSPSFWLLLVVALVMVAGPASAQSKRPTVALLDFDYASINHWWEANQDIGKGIADLVVDGLVEDGTYRVIERKRLDAILAEQNFSNSDRADPEAAKVAKSAWPQSAAPADAAIRMDDTPAQNRRGNRVSRAPILRAGRAKGHPPNANLPPRSITVHSPLRRADNLRAMPAVRYACVRVRDFS